MRPPSCATWRRAASTSPRRTCRRRARCRSESSHDPPHRGSDRALGVGHPGGRGSRQPAPDDDRAAAATFESGDPGALVRVRVGGLLRDGLRAALVTSVGLVLAWLARPLLAGALAVRDGRPALLLAAVVVAAGLAAGAAGTLRLLGTGPNLKWFAAGLGGGLLG